MRINLKSPLLILAITAFACSRTVLTSFDDPEGLNLLVITVFAAVIFLMSLAFHLSKAFPSLTGFKRAAATVLVQILVATASYLALR